MGLPAEERARIVGHEDSRTTDSIYVTVDINSVTKAVDKLDKAMDETSGGYNHDLISTGFEEQKSLRTSCSQAFPAVSARHVGYNCTIRGRCVHYCTIAYVSIVFRYQRCKNPMNQTVYMPITLLQDSGGI